MPQEERDVITSHFLRNDRHLDMKHAGGTKHWPTGRGVYRNYNKTFMVLVNIEDHMRFESMKDGSDVGKVLDRLNKGLRGFVSQIQFLRNAHLGWLTCSPINLGSTVRASVKIRLPKLTSNGRIDELCASLRLKARRLGEGDGTVYIISNKIIMGIFEHAAVMQMYKGVRELIRMEREAM